MGLGGELRRADSTEVRRYFLENALYWVREYHMDGLRLDAVHAIFDSSPTHILQEFASRVHELGKQLGREVSSSRSRIRMMQAGA